MQTVPHAGEQLIRTLRLHKVSMHASRFGKTLWNPTTDKMVKKCSEIFEHFVRFVARKKFSHIWISDAAGQRIIGRPSRALQPQQSPGHFLGKLQIQKQN